MIQPEISIVICTRNRCNQLGEALNSLSAMSAPEGLLWEVVIVDNGSTDATAEVVARFASRLPIRRVAEPTPGLSHARNRGVNEAKGAYILWTDDDVLVDAGWLKAYFEAICANPEAAVFGGKVTPVFLDQAPAWWKATGAQLENLIAKRDFGPTPCALSIERLPFGANYALRAAEQKGVAYDPGLGVRPGVKRLGEETQVIRAILQSGACGVWVPAAEVKHQIPPERLTLRYAISYFRAIGETWAYLDQTGGDNFMGPPIEAGAPRWLGAPRWVWRKAIEEVIAYELARIASPPSVWMEHLKMSSIYRGGLGYWTRRQAASPVRTRPSVA